MNKTSYICYNKIEVHQKNKNLGRKALEKVRKAPTEKINQWLKLLLVKLQTIELAHLTIDDLAQLSGKSKATIYKYFGSKEEVILAACQTRIDEVTPLIKNIHQDKDTPVEVRYRQLLEEFSARLADIRISFFHDVQLYYPIAWEAISGVSDLFVNLLNDLYQQGMNMGLFRPISIELLKALDRFFVTQIITNQSIFKDPNYTLKYLIRDYLRLRLEGLNKS